MSRPSKSQPSQAARPDFHCWPERSRRRSTSREAARGAAGGEGGDVWMASVGSVIVRPGGSGLAQDKVHCEAAANVGAGGAQVVEDTALATAGLFQRVREDGEAGCVQFSA